MECLFLLKIVFLYMA